MFPEGDSQQSEGQRSAAFSSTNGEPGATLDEDERTDLYSEFTNLDIDCWKHGHKLGHAEPCICMKASAEGIQPLLDATDLLKDNSELDKLKLTLRKFNRGSSITSLTVRQTPACDELLEMCLSLQGTNAEFEFTPEGMGLFREALKNWRQGVSDFCCNPNIDRAKKHRKKTRIAPRDLESGEVWFWSPFMDP
ncbi:hypothetical protein NG895_17690 [Aeoliella sp. ICT_H6.2]|uniref:Uncharacterized protein n=1 Tax=Aeoliella straminimaris TaxID=2954799 RepID=A0A9X2JII2_9BACT|nr:hypothetical protein [Aeoliella straminimaris]MCO6045733.1 hypothetical protein [Aeoliella straminimaris]